MTRSELRTVPKISVKIWKDVIKELDAKIDASCLRRDAYLRRVLEVELDYLDAEVSIPNSKASYDYVFATLDRFDRKLVSLALPTEITARLNDICARKRIVRDAFFNRLFLLLAAPQKLIDRLYFPLDYDEWKWRTEVWSEHRNDGPFFQNVFYPLEPDIDPFWPLRKGIEIATAEDKLEDYVEPETGATVRVQRTPTNEVQPVTSLYTTVFREKVNKDGVDLAGLSCYLPDWEIPGHAAEKQHQDKFAALFLDLGATA
jgi:hypothetical protein